MWSVTVTIKTKGRGACFTPQEQGDDGEYFGDGGVAWKTAVVMVLGCAVGGDKRERRRRCVMIIMKGVRVRVWVLYPNFALWSLKFPFSKTSHNNFNI